MTTARESPPIEPSALDRDELQQFILVPAAP
jgi:hypothetical protein